MGSAVWGAAVRQFVPAGWRGVLRWDGHRLLDEQGTFRGWASKDAAWRANTGDSGNLWTHTSCAASFDAACDAMAAHLRAAGFEVPERPEAT